MLVPIFLFLRFSAVLIIKLKIWLISVIPLHIFSHTQFIRIHPQTHGIVPVHFSVIISRLSLDNPLLFTLRNMKILLIPQWYNFSMISKPIGKTSRDLLQPEVRERLCRQWQSINTYYSCWSVLCSHLYHSLQWSLGLGTFHHGFPSCSSCLFIFYPLWPCAVHHCLHSLSLTPHSSSAQD